MTDNSQQPANGQQDSGSGATTNTSTTLTDATQRLLEQARLEIRAQKDRLAERERVAKENAEADELDRQILHAVFVLATEQMQVAKDERERPLKALQKQIDKHDKRFGSGSGNATSSAPPQLSAAPAPKQPQPRLELMQKVTEYHEPVQAKADKLGDPRLGKLLHEMDRDHMLPDFGAMLAAAGFKDEDQLRTVLGLSNEKTAKGQGPRVFRLFGGEDQGPRTSGGKKHI